VNCLLGPNELNAYNGGSLNKLHRESQILIVDDNMFNLTSLQTMIRMKFELTPSVCSEGSLSLKFIEERIKLAQPSQPPIQIIFMDCHMPLMDGF